jgi:membrane associated rhomboid family serine protease
MIRTLAVASERSLRFVAILWWIFIIDRVLLYGLGVTLADWGLAPRTAQGLIGIVTMPFLHGNAWHILANSISLLCVLLILYLEFRDEFHMPEVIFKIIISSGILLWIFGRGNAMHIGASALAYGLMTYTVTAGIMYRRASLIAFSVALLFFNGGGFIMGIIPTDPRVSWDGHLMGAIAGIIVASAGKEPTNDRRVEGSTEPD